MYNSLHYTYYLYIVMYYRNNLVSLGKNMTNPENFILSPFRGKNEVFGSLDILLKSCAKISAFLYI